MRGFPPVRYKFSPPSNTFLPRVIDPPDLPFVNITYRRLGRVEPLLIGGTQAVQVLKITDCSSILSAWLRGNTKKR